MGNHLMRHPFLPRKGAFGLPLYLGSSTPKSETEIKKDFTDHMNQGFEPASRWKVGITNNLNRRAREHDISFNNKPISREAKSEQEARNVESHFLGILGVQGSGGGGIGDGSAKYVYLFKVT